jgi:hypothetical protein
MNAQKTSGHVVDGLVPGFEAGTGATGCAGRCGSTFPVVGGLIKSDERFFRK